MPDLRGITMKTIRNLILSIALVFAFSVQASANVPWGTVSNLTGATPSPTSFTSAPVIIDLMTANTTMGALSGGTAGGFYTVILLQDGTGARTFTPPSNLTGLPASTPAAVTTANGYTAYVVELIGTNYVVQGEYDNVSLASTFKTTFSSAGTAVAPVTAQTQASVVIPGLTVANTCICEAQTTGSTWVATSLSCLPNTNFAQCVELNPSAATLTPTVATINVSIEN